MKAHNISIINILLLLVFFVSINITQAQTIPAAQQLIYQNNFDNLSHSSTTYPVGLQGWKIGSSSGASFKTVAPTIDLALNANSTASTTNGGIHNYNGKIGLLASSSVDPSIAISLNTTGFNNISITFDIMTIRNPYDGSNNTRLNNVELQYRIANSSGAFTSFSGSIYRNNTTTQTTTGVTTAQNPNTITVNLPSSCNNQEIIQIRWVQRDSIGAGARPSFAFDNICATGTSNITANNTTTFCEGNSVELSAINGESWLWSNNATTQNITVSQAGSYNVTVTKGIGCSSTATAVNVTVNNFNISGTIFTESIGSVLDFTAVDDYETANGFDNDNLTMSGTADVRYTTPSDGYTTASGGANVFFTLTEPVYYQISGINSSQYENLNLNFGIYKSTNASTGSGFIVEASTNGTNYTQLNYDALPTGSGTAIWHYRTTNFPIAENVYLRFRQTDSDTYYRIDDIKLTGILNHPFITQTFTTPVCQGDSILLTASAGNTYTWSNNSTAQTITVMQSGNYSVTVSDTNGCTATSTISVTFNTNPTANAGSDTTICLCSNFTLGGTPSASGTTQPYTYNWFPAEGINNAIAANPIAFIASTAVYHLVVTDSIGCVSDTSTINIDTTAIGCNVIDVQLTTHHQTIDSLGYFEIDTILGCFPPYKVLWMSDSLTTLADVEELFDSVPSISETGMTPEQYLALIEENYNNRIFTALKSGKYYFSIFDNAGHSKRFDIEIVKQIKWSTTNGIIIKGNTVTLDSLYENTGTTITAYTPVESDSLRSISFVVLNNYLEFAGGLRLASEAQSVIYTDIEYGFSLNNGTLKTIYNNTISDSIGSYTEGDTMRIRFNGDATVSYFKNRQVILTQNLSETGIFLADYILKLCVGCYLQNASDLFVAELSDDGFGNPVISWEAPEFTPLLVSNTNCSNPNGSITLDGSWAYGTIDNITWYSLLSEDPTQIIGTGNVLSNISLGKYRAAITYTTSSIIGGETFTKVMDINLCDEVEWKYNTSNIKLGKYLLNANTSGLVSTENNYGAVAFQDDEYGIGFSRINSMSSLSLAFGFLINNTLANDMESISISLIYNGVITSIFPSYRTTSNVEDYFIINLDIVRTDNNTYKYYIDNILVYSQQYSMSEELYLKALEGDNNANYFMSFQCTGKEVYIWQQASCGSNNLHSNTVTTFDENENPVSSSIVYYDALGRDVQSQSRIYSENKTLVSQNVFDAMGRTAIQSLPAPVNSNTLCYQPGFMNYSYTNFDGSAAPTALANNTENTLGWFYSNNNFVDKTIPASSYPFNRVEFSNDPLGRVTRKTLAGEAFYGTNNRATNTRYLSSGSELEGVFGSSVTAYEQFTIDADGKQYVNYSNSAGNVVATCRNNAGGSCRINLTKKSIYHNGIPETIIMSTTGKLYFKLNKRKLCSSYSFIDYHISVNGNPCGYSINTTTGEVSLDGNFTSQPTMILNISFSYTQAYFDIFYTSYTFGFPEQFIEYENLDYSDWTLYYYDNAGRLAKTVPPQGVDCYTYNTSLTSSDNYYTKDVRISNMNEGEGQQFGGQYNTGDADYYIGQEIYNSLDDVETEHIIDNANANLGLKQELEISVSLDGGCVGAPILPENQLPYFCRYLSNYLQGTGDGSQTSSFPGIDMTGNITSLKTINIENIPTSYTVSENNAILFDYDALHLKTQYIPHDPSDVCFNHCYNGIQDTYFDCVESDVDIATDCPKPVCYQKPPQVMAYYKLIVNVNATLATGVTQYPLWEDKSFAFYPVLYRNCKCQLSWDRTTLETFSTTFTPDLLQYLSGVNVSLISVQIRKPGEAIWKDIEKDSLVDDLTRFLRFFVDIKHSVDPNVTAPTHSMETTYTYDAMNRVKSITTPDEGLSEVVYDKSSRVRFTQNAVQRTTGAFSYINYDKLNRPLETGEYVGSVTFSTSMNAETTNLSSGTKTDDVLYYYDKPDAYFASTTSLSTTNYSQDYTSGKLTKSVGDNQTTWYGYNIKGQLIWLVQNIAGLGIKTLKYSYDAANRPNIIIYQAENYNERLDHSFIYDDDSHIKEVYTDEYDVDGTVKSHTKQAQYNYSLIGMLKRTEIAGNLQGIDYIYTLNGWLKSINTPLVASDITNKPITDPGKDGYSGPNLNFSKDLFGMNIDYYTDDYLRKGTYVNSNPSGTNHYTGLVKGITWNTLGQTQTAPSGKDYNAYLFTYDNKNRLTESQKAWYQHDYSKNQATGENNATGGASTLLDDYREWGIDYDLNGNIKTLKRNGNTSDNDMDNLIYNYGTGNLQNRLLSVTDYVTTSAYSTDLKNGQSSSNYEYDYAGRLTADLQAGAWYSYDSRGLVTAVHSDAARTHAVITYTYDERGNRSLKTNYNSSGNIVTETWYVYDSGGNTIAIYERDNQAGSPLLFEQPIYGLSRLGLLRKQENKLMYELTDHTGNVRAVFGKSSTGTAELLQFADYYPFGMEMPGRNDFTVSGTNWRFGYQGLFAERDGLTGKNDFMLRQYDSRLGRWLTKDPFGQYASPYMAMGNNPVSFIDPSGGYDYLEESIIRNQKFFDRSQKDFWGEHIPGASDAYSADNSKIDMNAMINESMANYYTNKYGNPEKGVWTYAEWGSEEKWYGVNSDENSLGEIIFHNLDLGWTGDQYSLGLDRNKALFGSSAVLSGEDLLNNFIYDHGNYTTTKGQYKNLYRPNGNPVNSQQAAKALSRSNWIKGIGTAGTVLSTVMAYNDIYQNGPNMRNVSDATVGTLGIATPYLAQYSAYASVANPYVAAGVAIYFGATTFFDITIHNTNEYMNKGMNPGMQFIRNKE